MKEKKGDTQRMPRLTDEEMEDLQWEQIEQEILLQEGSLPEPGPVPERRGNGSVGSQTQRFRFSRQHTDHMSAEEVALLAEEGISSPKDSPTPEEPPKPTALRSLVSFLVQLVIIFAAAFLIVTYVGQRTVVDGSSMWPTLNDGDNLWIDKLSYRFRDPERYEIVVFPYRYEADTYFIKRIIGLPGETVQILSDGTILIDGETLYEGYGAEPIYYAGLASEPLTLGEDEYFVMGDNRNNSKDSRFEAVGPIGRSDLLGHVVIRIWPFSEFGFVR